MTPSKPARRRVVSCRLLATLVALGGGAANAAPITVAFSGTMTSVTDPGGLLDPAVVVGAPFSGVYTIDPVVGSGFSFPTGVAYPLVTAGLTTASIAGVPFSGRIDFVDIGNDVTLPAGLSIPGGLADLWTTGVFVRTVPSPIIAAPVFTDSTLTRLSSNDFFVNQELTGWSSSWLVLYQVVAGPPGEAVPVPVDLASGTLTSLVAIPEPASAVLVAAGLFPVAASRMAAPRRPRRHLSR